MQVLLCFVLCISSLSPSFAVHLDSFPVPDLGEEFRTLTASDEHVFAATQHYLYRLSTSLTELQRNLLTPSTRLLLLSNASDVLLVCGENCVLVDARNLQLLWPSRQGDLSTILDPATSGQEDVGFDGILRTSSDPNFHELTYAMDSFFDVGSGGAVASRIVRGSIVRGPKDDPVNMPDMFLVTAMQTEQNPSTERRFIHAFSRGGFSYFVFIASLPDGVSVQARIARICDSDTGFRTSEDMSEGNFTSYIELGLFCGESSGQQTSAAYVPNPNAFGYDALVLSVGVERLSEVRNRLCAFRMPLVDQMMKAKIDECAEGVGVKGLERDGITEPCVQVQGDGLCSISPLEVETSYNTNHFLLVSGLEREADSFFSQLSLTTVDGYTFLFAGNGHGEIHQFAIVEQDAIVVRTFPADETNDEDIVDLLTSSDGLHMYFSTELAVYRYSLDVCESYKTCEECSRAGDLFCGWCTLEHKCTRRGGCGTFWVDSEGCVEITSTEPAIIHTEDLEAESVEMIKLTTVNLPALLTRIHCLYRLTQLTDSTHSLTDDVILQLRANGSRVGAKVVTCLLPDDIRDILLETIASSQSSILSFRIGLESENGVEFVTAPRDTRVINCSNFQSCGSCMAVGGHCRWCPLTFSCHLLIDSPVCTEGEVRRASDCPVLLPPITPTTPNYSLHVNLPARLRPQVLVRARKLGPLLSLFHLDLFECVVCLGQCATENDVVFRLLARAVATNEGNTLIDCLGETFYDLGKAPYLNAMVKIVYSPLNTALDSVMEKPTIILYTCSSAGQFCTECLSLPSTLNCNYCIAPGDALLPSNYQCRLSSTCDVTGDLVAVTTPAECSVIEPPVIDSITPSAGPVEGGTSIEIVGRNLGVEGSHIVDVIIGNNTICDVIDYLPGRRIVCGSRRGKQEMSNNVMVTLSYQSQRVVSNTNFSFTQPQLGSPPVIPNMGPRSGGTPLVINGSFLDIGTTRSVQIGDNSTCDIVSISSHEIVCITRPEPDLDIISSPLFLMTVSIDGWSRTTITYKYSRDPKVDSVSPLSSIASGGTTYIIEGKDLSIAQIRHLVFYLIPVKEDTPSMADNQNDGPPTESPPEGPPDNSKGPTFSVPTPLLITDPVTKCAETWDYKSEACSGRRNEMLACLAPPLSPGRYHIGLLMDAACHLLDLKMAVTVYQDPVFIPFDEPQVFSETEFLTKDVVINIKGQRLYFAPYDLDLELEPCDSEERCLCEVLPLNTTNTDDTQYIQCALAASNLQVLPRDQPITMTAKLGNFRGEIGEIMIMSTSEMNRPQSHRDGDVYVATGITAFVVVLLVATVVAGAIVTYRWRESKRMKEMRIREEMETKDNHLEKLVTEFAKSLPPKLFIHAKQLRIVESVGQGEYGIVYKAHLTRGGLPKLVAVKTIKGFISVTNIQKMMEEIVIMQQFNHPNVLHLLGVVVVGLSGPSIVMPFMANGNLSSYLKKNQETVVLSALEDSESVVSARKLLLDVCLQIARGMQYLSDRNFIHRDLAARNCMIDGDGIIKVADFGLAVEEVNSKGYFRQDKSDSVRLPFKWMALESLQEGVFTTKTDVWSFGVTMWEVFCGGRSPYPGVEAHTLPNLLQHGHRLEMPNNAACPKHIYTLIHQCWSPDPETRPSFSSLVADLTDCLTAISDYLTLDHNCTNSTDTVLDSSNMLRSNTSVRYVSDPSLPRGLPGSYAGYIDVTNDNLGSDGSRSNSPTDSCSIVMVNNETESLSNQPINLVVDTTDEDISTCGFQYIKGHQV